MLNYDVNVSYKTKRYCHHVYDDILLDFSESEHDVAEVVLLNRQPKSIYNGLLRAKHRLELEHIYIHFSNDIVYLQKE